MKGVSLLVLENLKRINGRSRKLSLFSSISGRFDELTGCLRLE